jgi:hypothetical protein
MVDRLPVTQPVFLIAKRFKRGCFPAVLDKCGPLRSASSLWTMARIGRARASYAGYLRTDCEKIK